MVTLSNVSKSFNDKQILKNVNLSLGKNEVVGLIGKNGSGKTTLLKIIIGEILSGKGNVQKGNEIIGYLSQNPDFKEFTVEEFLTSKITNPNDNYKIKLALKSLELSEIDKDQLAENLSGGQKTRLYLASLLLSDPTTLLLDEPTNNLDMEGLVWLGNFIANFKGTILLVSHDRALLDEVADRIIELEEGEVRNYGGNYSFYREQKLVEKKTALEKYRENIEEVKKIERLIVEKRERVQEIAKDKGREHEKFQRGFFNERTTKKAASNKRALQSRLEQIGKLERPKERISYPFGFEGQIHSDKFILGAKDVSKSYNGRSVLQAASFSISGNQRVWLSGSNGSGKTTLLNILLGRLKPDKGNVEVGKDIKMGYFSQEASQLDMSKTGIEELKKTGIIETDCFKYAMNLHLNPYDLRQPISELSRGQVAKLEFIKLLIGKNHILILDEPTNHLEIETREEIEEAIKDYQGAILVVSHDRYFLDEIGIDRKLEIQSVKLQEVPF